MTYSIKSGGYFSIYLLGVKRGSCMLVARGSLCKLSLQCYENSIERGGMQLQRHGVSLRSFKSVLISRTQRQY